MATSLENVMTQQEKCLSVRIRVTQHHCVTGLNQFPDAIFRDLLAKAQTGEGSAGAVKEKNGL